MEYCVSKKTDVFVVQTLNAISSVGLQRLDHRFFETVDQHAAPDAILLRSYNLHEMSIPESVRAIGRAGAGTNNIPVAALTARGVPVFNAPGANANAVKELVMAAMLLASRHLCQAWSHTRQVRCDVATLQETIEKSKKVFSGSELSGKTLAVIGLGHIGVKVANMARYLGMDVIGYDPGMTVQHAWNLRSSVRQATQLKEALSCADYISLHVPLLDSTRDMIDAAALQWVKPTATLINMARGGIVEKTAVRDILDAEKLQYYVCDFPEYDFLQHDRIIQLPHLGASTKEAEENCAKMVAEQVSDYLMHGVITNAVNFPAVALPRTDAMRLAVIHHNVPSMVASISQLLSEHAINIRDMVNASKQSVAYTLIDSDQAVAANIVEQLVGMDHVIQARVL